MHADYDLMARAASMTAVRKIETIVAEFDDSGMSGDIDQLCKSIGELREIRRQLGLDTFPLAWKMMFLRAAMKRTLRAISPIQTYTWLYRSIAERGSRQ